MSAYVVQVTLVLILTLINAHAKKPPGYVAPPKEYDPNPPKYEYGYRIQEDKSTHGKDEQRDGIYAQGRYYVENGTDSSQNVKYFADDWGYHPVVEYSNTGPYSKSSTNFVLGEEAIKLKNKQKSIPQDPSDPGKAESLSKLDPSSQQIGHQPTVHDPPLTVQPQTIQIDPASTLQPLVQPNPYLHVQEDPTNNVFPVVVQTTPSALLQNNELNYQSVDPPLNPIASQTQILVHDQPQLILQNDPHLQVLTNQPDQKLQNRELIIDPVSQFKSALSDPWNSHPQPIFYYVQPQQVEPTSIESLPQSYIQQPTETSNQLVQLFHPVEQIPQPIQHHISLQQPEDQNLEEHLPQPQELINRDKKEHDPCSNPSAIAELQVVTNNGVVDAKEDNKQVLETAALMKTPNQIVQFENSAPEFYYKEFGARLNPKYIQLNNDKLIESTKNLVSGADVLNINAAVAHEHDDIETSTLQSLLQQYVTPAIVNNHLNVEFNQEGVVSSTTLAPPISTVETSFLKEPIIVAEAESDSDSKPVNEKTDENEDFFSSTARNTLATLGSGKENIESSSDQIIVTPRPVSSKFLAPITAGIQLQDVEEQLFEDTKTKETHEKKQEKVLIQVQKTIPYYLGMYEYPTGYDGQVRDRNKTEHGTNAEQEAVENIELGKTLLYFPEQESPKAEQLIQEQPKVEQSQILVDVDSNHLGSQQIPYESKKETFTDQQVLQGENQELEQNEEHISATGEQFQQQNYLQNVQAQEYIRERPSYNQVTISQAAETSNTVVEKSIPYPQSSPVEKLVDRPVHVPIEVTKYIDRPYPVEVRVPYPQPYPVEKIIKEPYPVEVKVPVHVEVPVEKIVERKIPVPYYIERPVEKILERPVEKIVERTIPVPYYIEKPIEKIVEKPVPHYIERPYPVHEPVSSQAFLLQIPGLFSQQKYSTLVHNTYQPQNALFQNSLLNGYQGNTLIGQNQKYPVLYAPQNNQYLPPKQNIPINKGQIPHKLKKLNLLVFPRVNMANLPPITKSSHDLYRNPLSYQSYRYSNAQLNNGYLPPAPQNNNLDCEVKALASSTSNVYNVRKPEEHIGLIPPKRPFFDDSRKHRHARAHFDDKSIRLEYGFMPPLIPSLEIDEQGQPIENRDSKK